MKRHVAAGLMVAAVVAAGVFAGPRLLDAQQGKPTGPRVIVVNDVAHVVSGRLGGMKPIPPAKGLRKQIALRHAHPVQSAVQPAAPDPALQTSTGPLVSTTSGSNFLGVGVGQGNYSDCCAPPDTNGAAGATQYVQWVNTDFAVFSKSTGKITYGPAAGNTLWGPLGGACASNNSGDPVAQYDQQAQRWVMMQPVFKSPYDLCVAVSTGPDATGTYNLYQFPISNGHFPDYPKLAVWPDGYYVSYNDFGSGGGNYSGAYACALDRAAMLQGSAATMQCVNTGTSNFSLLPADLDGASSAPGTTAAPPAGAPEDFIAMDYNTFNALEVFKFHVDWSNSSNSTFTGPSLIPVDAISEACGGGTCIPQSGTSQQLDSLGDRLMYRFAYRNFGSYQSWVVSQSVATGSGNTTGIRWYEIRDSGQGMSLYQQGTFAPDSNYRWMPSIAEDESGDIALGYSVSSSTMHPAIRFTGRVPGDPLGTMESESSIVEGGGSQSYILGLSRWGDYSSMSVDPTDDCTFWYTNEYLQADGAFNWSTQIASFTFPGCATAATPDFSLSASPTSQTVTQGASTTSTISVTPSNGYTGSVNLSVSSTLPSGMTVGFSTNPADITGSSAVDSTLTVNTTSSTPTGTYDLTVSGNDGTTTHTTQFSVTVQAPPDFSLSGTPSSSTVTAGNNTTYTIGVAPSNGYTGSVNLSVTNSLPAGMTAGFSPNPAVVSGTSTVNSTLTVTTTASTTPGTYNLTVSGTDTTLTHTTQVSIVVQAPPPPDFSLSSSPSSQTVTAGSPASYTIAVSPSGGFTGTVALSTTGLPAGATPSFNPTSVTGGSGTSTLTVSTSSSLAAGTYNFNVVGTSGSLNHSIGLTLTVQQQTSSDFTISATPSISSATQGSSTAYTVTVGGSGGNPFNGTVNLSVGGVPSRTSASFSTTSITGSGSATLTVSPHHNAKNGTYTLTITGTSGSLSHSTTVTFVIGTISSPDFSLSGSPSSLSVAPGSGASSSISVTPSNGYTGTVTLGVTGAPSGATASLSPTSVSITSSSAVSSTLTVTTSASTPAGTYTLTVTGTDGTLSHSTNVTLTVQSSGGSGDFSLSATTPGPLTAKSSTTSMITITPSGGFSGGVSLSVSGLPHGTSATFNPSTATTSSTLTISAGGHPQTGPFTLTITGTSGSLSHSTNVTLTVN